MSVQSDAILKVLGQVPSQVQQFGEGDLNAWNNCVPTSIMLLRAAYRLPVADPQRATDGVYGRTYIGGESFWQAEAWVEANLGPAPGPMGGGQGLDVLDAVLREGFGVIAFFNCDINATITMGFAGFYHASLVLDHQPGDWWVLNVHDYSEHHFNDVQMDAAMNGAGGFVDYERSLEDTMTLSEKRAWVRATYLAALEREPTPEDLDGWANQIANDGSNVNEIMAAIADSGEGQGNRTLVNAVKGLFRLEPDGVTATLNLSKLPAGPKGDPGPPGPPGEAATISDSQLQAAVAAYLQAHPITFPPRPPAGALDWIRQLLDWFTSH